MINEILAAVSPTSTTCSFNITTELTVPSFFTSNSIFSSDLEYPSGDVISTKTYLPASIPSIIYGVSVETHSYKILM